MEIANVMSERPGPFVPPAPRPREKPVGRFEMMRVVYKTRSSCGANRPTMSGGFPLAGSA